MKTATIDRRLSAWTARPRVVIAALLIAAAIFALLFAFDMRYHKYRHGYDYEIRGTISASSDGTPLSEVVVWLRLNPQGRASKSASETPHGWVLTNEDGKFLLHTKITSYEFSNLPKWDLELTKPGYKRRRVDISQHGEPKSGSPPYLVAVAAEMRPEEPGATPGL